MCMARWLSAAVVIETCGSPVGNFCKLTFRRAQFTAEIYISLPAGRDKVISIHTHELKQI